MSSISILRPDLESSLQAASFIPQNEKRGKALFFDPRCNFNTLLARGRAGTKTLEKRKMPTCFHRYRA